MKGKRNIQKKSEGKLHVKTIMQFENDLSIIYKTCVPGKYY